MRIWKPFSVFVMSLLMVATLAACISQPGADSATSAPPTVAPTSVPTTAAPTSVPTTGGAQSTGACTTTASCQAAVITVTPNKVKAGGKVTVTVKGWMANTQAVVAISLPTDQGQPSVAPVVAATSDAQGNLTATLTTYPNVSPATADVSIGQDQSGSNAVDTSKDLMMKGGLTIIH